MPFVPFIDGAEFVMSVRNLNTNKDAKNIFNVTSTGSAWTPERLTEVCEAIRDWWDESMSGWTSTDVELVSVLGRALAVQDSYVVELPTAVPGTGVQNILPFSNTIALKETTGLAGRSFRGRLYHIGLTENEVAADYVNGPTAAGLLAAYELLRTDVFPGVAATWCVFSRYSDGNVRATGLATPITTLSWNDLRVDTQRRRLASV